MEEYVGMQGQVTADVSLWEGLDIDLTMGEVAESTPMNTVTWAPLLE